MRRGARGGTYEQDLVRKAAKRLGEIALKVGVSEQIMISLLGRKPTGNGDHAKRKGKLWT